MKTAKKTIALVIAAGSLAVVGVTGSSGCATPHESTGSSSADLYTPIPLFHSIASSTTQKALNIYEWRVYKGKHEYTVTGYDATGHAVSGFAIGAYGHTDSTPAHLRARMLDGTQSVVRPVFGGASLSTGALGSKSTAFLARATADFGAIKGDLNEESIAFGGSSGVGLHALGNPTSSSGGASTTCATDLMTMLTDSMACGAAMSKTPGATAASIPACMKSVTDIAAVETACAAATSSSGGKASDAGSGSGSGGSKGGGSGSGGSKGGGSGGSGGKDSGGGNNGNNSGNNVKDSGPPSNNQPDASPNPQPQQDAAPPTNSTDDAGPVDDPSQDDAGPNNNPSGDDASTDPSQGDQSDGGADDPEQCTDDTTCASQTDSDSADQTCESCPEGSSDSADTSDDSDNGDVGMGDDSGDDDFDDSDDDDFGDSYNVHVTRY